MIKQVIINEQSEDLKEQFREIYEDLKKIAEEQAIIKIDSDKVSLRLKEIMAELEKNEETN